jgi:hypothetical protein
MANLKHQSDDQLMEDYESAYGKEQRRIGHELESRGYNENHSSGTWTYSGGIEEGISIVFLAILIAIILMFIGSPYIIGHLLLDDIPNLIMKEARPYFPLNSPFDYQELEVKAALSILSLLLICLIMNFVLVLWIPFRKKIHFSYFLKFFYLFFLFSSVYFGYIESKTNPVSTNFIICYVITFALALLLLFKTNKNWKNGLCLAILSSIGFILAGNSLISPFWFLNMAAVSIIFAPGKFFEKPKAKKKIKENNSMRAS